MNIHNKQCKNITETQCTDPHLRHLKCTHLNSIQFMRLFKHRFKIFKPMPQAQWPHRNEVYAEYYSEKTWSSNSVLNT